MNSLYNSPSLINFQACFDEFPPFLGLWLLEQFLCISRQTADWIELKFGGWILYGTPQAWLTFGHVLLNFHSFLVCDLLMNCCSFTHKILIELSSNLVEEKHFGIPRPGVINFPSCSFQFLLFHGLWLQSSFYAFGDTLLGWITLNLVHITSTYFFLQTFIKTIHYPLQGLQAPGGYSEKFLTGVCGSGFRSDTLG